MYTPKPFRIDDKDKVLAFIRANAFGQLVSINNGRITSSHLPFLFNESNTNLLCHVAKQNAQWKDIEGQEVLITFEGVHGYISPTWYKTSGVPTWNYQAAHVYGTAHIISDETLVKDMVNKLTAIYESEQEQPWKPEYKDSLLQAIVGIEVRITDIQYKFKMGQNRSKEDRVNVIQALEKQGVSKLAQVMKDNLSD
jgi:transcriptional regulator